MDELKKLDKKEDILVKYNIPNCIQLYRKTETALQASKSDSPSLVTIKNEHGEKLSLTIIRIWLTSVNDFINSARKLTPNQIDELSIYILDDYYYFNMADLFLITSRIKKGFYGNLYETLDGMKILSFFNTYNNERLIDNESESIKESDKFKYLEEKSGFERKSTSEKEDFNSMKISHLINEVKNKK